ncbi:hypothetical protein HanXRQr2_Chr07g0304761 [Helianthus annuus]|uniref:Uncharacterized protein n=1 Tax=Helianthus annuus TaxID=4232 RepID=A0A9K3NH22_HELAN|nr:hypothetical protein HanXRQr2_Chr07g0304761 [Helianthus annuus]KAJ0905537.1 hypothetical protein HanPSC8_Chr07g0295091 [Helianthus annuus]
MVFFWREVVIGGVEWNFNEANGRGGGKGAAEISDVERGVDEGDLVALLFELKG